MCDWKGVLLYRASKGRNPFSWEPLEGQQRTGLVICKQAEKKTDREIQLTTVTGPLSTSLSRWTFSSDDTRHTTYYLLRPSSVNRVAEQKFGQIQAR
jgi:hypothetical protein